MGKVTPGDETPAHPRTTEKRTKKTQAPTKAGVNAQTTPLEGVKDASTPPPSPSAPLQALRPQPASAVDVGRLGREGRVFRFITQYNVPRRRGGFAPAQSASNSSRAEGAAIARPVAPPLTPEQRRVIWEGRRSLRLCA